MIHFFPFCSGWVLWQKWWNHVLLSINSTSERAVSFVIDFDCFLVDWGWGFGSWQESVQDFHTCADLVIKDFESFFLACLFLNVKGTEVEPKPCWGSQECESGLIISSFTKVTSGLGFSINVIEKGEIFQTKLISYCEEGWNKPLSEVMSSCDVKIGFNLFGCQVQSFIGLLYNIGSFFISPEIPWDGFILAVVCGVSWESWHYYFYLKNKWLIITWPFYLIFKIKSQNEIFLIQKDCNMQKYEVHLNK